jgi:hypothetical protein
MVFPNECRPWPHQAANLQGGIMHNVREFEGIPTEAAQYLREAENEYLRIVSIGQSIPEDLSAEINRIREEIGKKIEQGSYSATQVTWRSLSELEQLIVYATPDAELPVKLGHIVRRYERVLGASVLEQYKSEAGATWMITEPATLRIHASQMLREIYRIHAAAHFREVALTALAIWMCKFVGAGLIVIFALCIYSILRCGELAACNEAFLQPLIPVIFYCGMVGSFISILRRLQEQRDSLLTGSDAIQVLIGLRTGRASVGVGLFSGGIFALVLYLILMSGLLGDGGGLLPQFGEPSGSDGNLSSFAAFLNEFGPGGALDYAKVLVWSLVAGFGERFVPDVLDRLQAQAASKQGGK